MRERTLMTAVHENVGATGLPDGIATQLFIGGQAASRTSPRDPLSESPFNSESDPSAVPDHPHHPIDRNWQHRASCRGTDTDMFFSPDGERGNVRARRERAAKQLCQDCPVLDNCRAHALTTTETYGIWGGLSETERARHTRRTRRATSRSPGGTLRRLTL